MLAKGDSARKRINESVRDSAFGVWGSGVRPEVSGFGLGRDRGGLGVEAIESKALTP
jgi:hypothetical protein